MDLNSLNTVCMLHLYVTYIPSVLNQYVKVLCVTFTIAHLKRNLALFSVFDESSLADLCSVRDRFEDSKSQLCGDVRLFAKRSQHTH
jgi:hypothetical protein